MKNLLNSYFYVGEQDFFNDFDGRRNEYSQILQLKYRNFGGETVKGKKEYCFGIRTLKKDSSFITNIILSLNASLTEGNKL